MLKRRSAEFVGLLSDLSTLVGALSEGLSEVVGNSSWAESRQICWGPRRLGDSGPVLLFFFPFKWLWCLCTGLARSSTDFGDSGADLPRREKKRRNRETNVFTTAGADASGRSTGKNSTGNDFPRKYQRIPRNYYQRWGTNIEHNFSSQTFRAPPGYDIISRQVSRDIPLESLFSLGLAGHTERPTPHRKTSEPRSVF